MQRGPSLPGPDGPRRLRPVLLLAGLLVLAGCQQDDVARYQVPRAGDQREVRLLAAIVNQDKASWFFKLVGPDDTVTKHEADFRGFVAGLTFPDGDKAAWKLPAGWEEKPGNQIRYATLAMPDQLNVTVFKFEAQPQLLLQNVNRWRKQDLGLPDLEQADLDKNLEKVKLDKGEALLVNSKGPGPKKGRPVMGGNDGK